jgi:hypothetical protein
LIAAEQRAGWDWVPTAAEQPIVEQSSTTQYQNSMPTLADAGQPTPANGMNDPINGCQIFRIQGCTQNGTGQAPAIANGEAAGFPNAGKQISQHIFVKPIRLNHDEFRAPRIESWMKGKALMISGQSIGYGWIWNRSNKRE